MRRGDVFGVFGVYLEFVTRVRVELRHRRLLLVSQLASIFAQLVWDSFVIVLTWKPHRP